MTVYRSKIDWWLAAILVFGMAVSLLASIKVITASSAGWWVLLITVGLGVGLPLWLLLGTYYSIERDQLLIKSGPFKWKVPIDDITSITPTSDAISGPALSLERLRIEYGRGASVLISPRDRGQLMRDIEAVRRGA